MRSLLAVAGFVAASALAAQALSIAPFSTAEPGALPPGWRELSLPGIRAPQFALIREDGATVLRIRAEGAAGTVAHTLDAPPDAYLSWRWKVDRVVERADMATRAGDDYAARVYVFFDVPLAELSFVQRAKIRIARALHGTELPTAAICYVWDNRHPAGTVMPNAYTERVRMVVLESGSEDAGKWREERRDLEADYRRAFAIGPERRVPRVSGVGASADTDQTAETVTAWFGDFRIEPRP